MPAGTCCEGRKPKHEAPGLPSLACLDVIAGTTTGASAQTLLQLVGGAALGPAVAVAAAAAAVVAEVAAAVARLQVAMTVR